MVQERWVNCYLTPRYEVSDAGQVRNKNTGYILTRLKDGEGYLMVHLQLPFKSGTRKLAPIVYKSFNPNFDLNSVVRYLDGDKGNCSLENLYQQSISEHNRERYMNIPAAKKKEIIRLARIAKEKKYSKEELQDICRYANRFRWGREKLKRKADAEGITHGRRVAFYAGIRG